MPRRLLPPAHARPSTVQKAAVRLCPNGHRQAITWKRGNPCKACWLAEITRIENDEELMTREQWAERIGPAPAVMEIPVVREGRLLRFAIPKHLKKPPPRRRLGRRKR